MNAGATQSRARRGRALRDGLAVAGLLLAGYLFLVIAPGARTVGFDAFAYWAVNVGHPYDHVAGRTRALSREDPPADRRPRAAT